MNFIKDKIVVVIGASSGIGAFTAEYLAENGAIVHIAARREERLNKIFKRLSEKGCKISYSVCDATEYPSVKKIADDMVEKYGKIDLWLNCVGQNNVIGKAWDVDIDLTRIEIEANLRCCINSIHAALQNMVKINNGRIVTLCGGGAPFPNVYSAAFSASKTGMARFIETTVLELKNDNINVQIFPLNPTLIYNERTAALLTLEEGRNYFPWLAASFAENRHQDPLVIAKHIAYFLSGELDFCSGRMIYSSDDFQPLFNIKEKIKKSSYGFLRASK